MKRVENHGRYIAEIPEQLIDEEKVKQSNLMLRHRYHRHKAGIKPKTTVPSALLGLNRIGKKAIVALREPSLGPCFRDEGAAGEDMHRCFLWMRSTSICKLIFT